MDFCYHQKLKGFKSKRTYPTKNIEGSLLYCLAYFILMYCKHIFKKYIPYIFWVHLSVFKDNDLFFQFEKLFAYIMLHLIYSSTDSSESPEENFKSNVNQI